MLPFMYLIGMKSQYLSDCCIYAPRLTAVIIDFAEVNNLKSLKTSSDFAASPSSHPAIIQRANANGARSLSTTKPRRALKAIAAVSCADEV